MMVSNIRNIPSGARSTPSILDTIRADWRTGAAISLGAAGGFGLLTGWWTPRGPLTTAESLATMIVGLLVGIIAGLVLRSRWAMLGAPAVFVVMFEATRLSTDGPTVDEIHTSTYGVLAFIVGRGFHALVGLTPMILGAALGAGIARSLSPRTPSGTHRGTAGMYVRRTVAALTATAMIILAALIARPAATSPILGKDGKQLAEGIAELTTVKTGGKNLGLMLRGVSVENPVLLFLAGGPGGSELGAIRNHLPALEESFVVATLDQRGTGTSYPDLDPASTLTLESYIKIDFRDTVTSLRAPVYFVQGAHEARGRAEPFREWFGVLEAPSKHVIEFPGTGHRPLFERPDEFIEYMNNTVLAQTLRSSDKVKKLK